MKIIFIISAILTFSLVSQANTYDYFLNLAKSNPAFAPKAAKPNPPPVDPEKFNIEKHLLIPSMEGIRAIESKANQRQALRSGAEVLFEKVSAVSTPTHTDITAEYVEDKVIFKLRYDEVALQKPQLLLRDLATLEVIFHGHSNYFAIDTVLLKASFQTYLYQETLAVHSLAELLANIKVGSPTSKARWNSLQTGLLANAQLKPEMAEKLGVPADALAQIHQSLAKAQPSLDAQASKWLQAQKKALAQWRKSSGTLEHYESLNLKLNDLILNNDRAGVRKMLEAYLPWSLMEPVETRAWKIWLEAIEKPNWQNTSVAWRGVDFDIDKVQRKKTANGESVAFMSTLLTKNQGNYTRRLRSLVTSRERNGDLAAPSHTGPMAIKITDQMNSHANQPVASSFISFTYNPTVARSFVGFKEDPSGQKRPHGGLLVVRMDSRRLVPNLTSFYAREIELLAPLIIFPDEVVRFKEGFYSEADLNGLIKEVFDKTGVRFEAYKSVTPAEPQSSELDALTKKFRLEGYGFFKEINSVTGAQACGRIFL